jgi:hypothetical protein
MRRDLRLRRIALGFLLGLLCSIIDASAQTMGQQPSRSEKLRQQQTITGGVGLTYLDGKPFYVRVGALDYARLGHGSIVSLYRNSASYDMRKIGVELDADFEKFGFESMSSDVAGAGVLGVPGYVRPLQYTSASSARSMSSVAINLRQEYGTPERSLVVSMFYEWTYAEEKDPITGRVIGYKTQKRIEPWVGFVMFF